MTDAVPLTGRRIAVVLMVGLIVRAALMSLIHYRVDAGDAVGYDLLARNLVEHGVYSLEVAPPFRPTLLRPPAFPFLVAGSYALFGPRPIAVQLLQVALSCAVPFLVHALARRLWPRVATAALWATMLCPFDIFYTGALLSETLCTAALVAGVALPALRPGKLGAWVAGGFAFGVCLLTRDVYLPACAAMVAVAWLVKDARFGAPRRMPLAFSLAAALTVAPWTARNVVSTGQLALVSKGLLGFNLWVGTWERDGNWVAARAAGYPPYAYRDDRERERVAALERSTSSQEQDRGFRALAVERWRAEPAAVAARGVARTRFMWLGTRSDLFEFWPAPLRAGAPSWYALKAGLWALNLAVIASAMVGMAVAIRRERRALWLVAPIAMNAAVYVPFHSTETRYSQPVYPLVVLFACVGAMTAVEVVRRQSAVSQTSPAVPDAPTYP